MSVNHELLEKNPEKVLPMKGRHELLELDPERILPEVDVTIVACRSSSPRGKGYVFDLIDSEQILKEIIEKFG